MKIRSNIIGFATGIFGCVLMLLIVVGFFKIQYHNMGNYVLVGYIVACFLLVILLDRVRGKVVAKDPDDDTWPEFARDRITEDTSRPGWKTAISVLGMICCFFAVFGLMLFAMFIVMTSGGSVFHLLKPLSVIAIMWLIGYGLIVISRRRCRLCGSRVHVKHRPSSEAIDGYEDWLVCFNCKIRAVAPPWESEANGD